MKLVTLAACVLLAMGLLALPACGGDESEASAGPRPAGSSTALVVSSASIKNGTKAALKGQETPFTPEGKLVFPLRKSRGFLVTDLQGRALRTVTAPRGRRVGGRPAFGPDGRRLWFLTGAGAAGLRSMRLHVIAAAGRGAGRSYAFTQKGVVVSTPESTVTGLLVSPNEDRIAIGGDPGSGGCWAGAIVSARGRLIRRLTARGNVQVNISSWSPRSSRLVYSHYRWDECGRITPRATLLMTGPRGNAPDNQLAAQVNGSFSAAVWSPDERRVAFNQCDLQASTSTCPLVVIETASRKRRLLARDSYPGKVVWAAKTDEIVALRVEGDEGVWAFKSDGSGRRKLAGLADILAASRDGDRVVIGGGGRRVIDVQSGKAWVFPTAARRQFGSGAIAHFVR